MDEQESQVIERRDAVHVVPLADVREHDLKGVCPCRPEMSLADSDYHYDQALVVHNSFRDSDIVDAALTQLFNERLPSA